jgi:hypothetical protein
MLTMLQKFIPKINVTNSLRYAHAKKTRRAVTLRDDAITILEQVNFFRAY